MSDIVIVFRDMCQECEEQVGLTHTKECRFDGKVKKRQSVEKGTTPESAEAATAELLKTNLAARLRSMAGAMEIMTGADEATVKLIFDLKASARLLDKLDELNDLIDDAESITEWSGIKSVSQRIAREKAKGSDPEPKMG
jgi:hypothetical protein